MAKEMRLIDADALKMSLCTKEGAEALGHSTVKLARVSAIVDAQHTVDAVEVLRCKNCKFWSDGVAGCTEHVKICTIGYYMVAENGYCYFGERREE